MEAHLESKYMLASGRQWSENGGTRGSQLSGHTNGMLEDKYGAHAEYSAPISTSLVDKRGGRINSPLTAEWIAIAIVFDSKVQAYKLA